MTPSAAGYFIQKCSWSKLSHHRQSERSGWRPTLQNWDNSFPKFVQNPIFLSFISFLLSRYLTDWCIYHQQGTLKRRWHWYYWETTAVVLLGHLMEDDQNFLCISSWGEKWWTFQKRLDAGFPTGFCHVGTFKNPIRCLMSGLSA